MNLSNARVLVTGATGGIGSAIVEELMRRGASVLMTGRNRATARSDRPPIRLLSFPPGLASCRARAAAILPATTSDDSGSAPSIIAAALIRASVTHTSMRSRNGPEIRPT